MRTTQWKEDYYAIPHSHLARISATTCHHLGVHTIERGMPKEKYASRQAFKTSKKIAIKLLPFVIDQLHLQDC